MLGVIFVVVPGIAIQAERRGLEFDRSQWCALCFMCEIFERNLNAFFRVGAGKMELDREAAEKRAAWEELSSKSKITHWLVRHQYSIIFSSWLGACAVAGSIIWKNKQVHLVSDGFILAF
jgi:hypothetical protein